MAQGRMKSKLQTFCQTELLFLLLLLPHAPSVSAASSGRIPLAAQWDRFEASFRSSVAYTNPLQQATLSVVFTSPLGEVSRIYGFWDGGKTWRVRFSPDQPGRWTFQTSCSDASNKGLNDQRGEFVCTAAIGKSRFALHGPVRVAADHHHFNHADGTPFFWLADTAWNGAVASRPEDWNLYARARAAQNFNVAQWSVAPGPDIANESAFTGTDSIAINLAFFKRLDAKIETLRRAGILSAIAPLMEMESQKANFTALPDGQAALLVRYAVARWGADPVAWVLAFDGDPQTKKVGRWKKIGQSVF